MVLAPYTPYELKMKVKKSLQLLCMHDSVLIRNDVSERAITHMLAVYLQSEFPGLNVDCEYNRNWGLGQRKPKYITILTQRARNKRKGKCGAPDNEEGTGVVTVYPDIIVHKRLRNCSNVLVVEVKKDSSQCKEDCFDHEKLKAFTSSQDDNDYKYSLGVFIKLPIGRYLCREGNSQYVEDAIDPEEFHKFCSILWFQDGSILERV